MPVDYEMQERKKALIFGVFIVALLVVTVGLFIFSLSGVSFCLPIHGIDHNGNDDPFTIFLGVC